MVKVVLDVDGPAARFHHHVSEILNLEKKEEDFKSREITDELDEREKKLYYELLATPEFWGTLPVRPEAQKIVTAARKAGHRIRWSTSPWLGCREWGHMRYHWLGEHFDAKPGDVHIGAAKEDIEGDIFIDDLVENVEKWQREHPRGLAYLFKASYNEAGGRAFQRVTWEDIAKILRVIV